MIRRIYIDTSVAGGYFDKEFELATIPLFQRISNLELVVLISDVFQAELLGAPVFVRDLVFHLPPSQVENIALNPESAALARKYVEENVVGKTSIADCQHIAMATIARADVLVSWNFKHIVNLERIRGYNAINYLMGYPMIEIRTPKEILKDE